MGLVSVNINSYDGFRNDVLGHEFNVDNSPTLIYQCWDLAAELWMNIPYFHALGGLYPQTGPLGYASEIWTVSRIQNAATQFTTFTDYKQIKRGDVLVLAPSVYFPTTGHVCFADEDYDPNGEEPTKIQCMGQNQDPEHSNPTVGYKATLNKLHVGGYLLGAFRYKEWDNTPPTPTTINKKRGYKFWIYGNVPKNRRNGY